MKKEFSQNWHYFYIGWVFHILTMSIIFVLEFFLLDESSYPGGHIPAYANAIQNITFRFPIWFFGTAILTILVVFIFFRKLKFLTKFLLVILNGLIVGIFSLIIIITPFVYFQLEIIISSVVLLIPMLVVYFLRKRQISFVKQKVIYSQK